MFPRIRDLALWLTAAALPCPAAVASSGAPPMLDAPAILRAHFGNDAAWYQNNIPLFESSDPKLDAVYYYRWSVFRAHQRDLGDKGYITTEFLDDVGWQREPYASLNDATGFHLYEARWLRNRRYAADYVDYLYAEGGNDRHFSEAIADAVWARYLVDHDAAAATRHLDAMRHVYGLWDDHFDFAKGLYWIEPLLDATEYTIASIDASGGADGFTGGHAFRPSINSYMVANARAIGRIAALAGEAAVGRDYAARGEALKARILADLWNPKLGHFTDRYRIDNQHVRYWAPIRGRELVGYLPWTFGLLDDRPQFASAWSHLLSPQGFAGAAGMRTVEPSYEYYMRQYRYDKDTGQRECQWNGPVWPFQTTQVLTGLARLLQGRKQDVIGRGDYLRLLRQYAALHYQGDRLDLEEDYDPESGKPIVGLARSHHYFHSGFDDLVITGLVGLQPSAGDEIVIDPLVPDDRRDPGRIRYFALQDVPYHGRTLTIFYDEDGTRYRQGPGLRVYVDGTLAASRPSLGQIVLPLESRPAQPIARPINRAVALLAFGFPRATASSNPDPAALHDAIDGRTWFFPELANGWTSSGAGPEEWLAVDFGRDVTLSSAELAFFAAGAVAAPRAYRFQAWAAGRWTDVSLLTASTPQPNGITAATWSPVTTSRLRVRFEKVPGTQIRLVELKAF